MAKEKEQRPMTKQVPALTARTQFGQILQRVSRNGERFVVTKKGEPTAVILGVEDFLQAVVQTSGFACSPANGGEKKRQRKNSASRRLKRK